MPQKQSAQQYIQHSNCVVVVLIKKNSTGHWRISSILMYLDSANETIVFYRKSLPIFANKLIDFKRTKTNFCSFEQFYILMNNSSSVNFLNIIFLLILNFLLKHLTYNIFQFGILNAYINNFIYITIYNLMNDI